MDNRVKYFPKPESPKKMLVEVGCVFAALCGVTLLLAWLGVDLAVTRKVWTPEGKFIYNRAEPWYFINRYGMYPMDLLAALGGAVAVSALFVKRTRRWWRQGLFFALLMAVAHGLIVNSYFKTHWGRPRPHMVAEFGGTREYREPWEKADDREAKSFPSSHSSAAFFMLSPWFVLRRRDRKKALLWLGGGIAYGSAMGVARIFNGAHFLTDVMWAGGVVYITGAVLAWLLSVEEAGTT